ncbi:MAG: methylmalonyl-CoA mutase small subunit [Chlorobi bacterium]|nr:methylmalonyl-CoA mutase small subunit [Chlorobiota bacterium]
MKPLFQEFKDVSPAAWENKILQDLGISSLKNLFRDTPEDISIHPFYTKEDLENQKFAGGRPGEFPFLRGSRTPGFSWKIQEEIPVYNSGEAGRQAATAIASGADRVAFTFPVRLDKCPDIRHLFNEINLAETAIVLIDHLNPYLLWSLFQQSVYRDSLDKQNVRGAIAYDPLGFLTQHGDYPSTEADALSWERDILAESIHDLPHIRTLEVNAGIFNDAGGSVVQEIAFALAMGKEYLDIYTGLDISVDDLLPRMGFSFATGPDYFMEIAKLRAFRVLWSWISKEYEPSQANDLKAQIHARTTLWNATLYDSYVNMLRATTEAMSAVLGGADVVTTYPYDYAYRKPGKFSARIARNIQLILKHESNFDKTVDPAAGSYYLEKLTRQVAEKAWHLFLKVEKAGGYRKALSGNFIQEEIRKVFLKRSNNLSTGKEALIGTNRYPLRGEKYPEHAEKINTGKPDIFFEKRIKPVPIRRASEVFEVLRQRTENHEKTPRVFLFGHGNPSIRSARETFAANFFTVAGFKIIDNISISTVEEGIRKIRKVMPEVVVLCAGNEDYPALTDTLCVELKTLPLLVVTGNPGEKRGELEQKGIRFFIHRESNIPEVLSEIQSDLGIHGQTEVMV